MRVKQIRYYQFRNLPDTTLELHPGFNVLTGRNGQGKTNILEGLYLLAMPRSFRGGRFDTWVMEGRDEGAVQCTLEDGDREHRLELFLQNGRRRYSLDGNRVAGVQEIARVLKVVFFGPDDLRLVKSGPAERRAFLDRAIYRSDPEHLRRVQEYQKLMRERNALLLDYGRGFLPGGLLESYEERLARTGAEITAVRARYAASITIDIQAYWRKLKPVTGGDFRLTYRNGYGLDMYDGKPEEDLEELALQSLRDKRERDLERGTTGAGPHLDELELLLGGQPARDRASQGQTRSLVAAMRIGEMLEWKRNHDVAPILMMDDLSSELDREHYEVVMEAIEDHAEQVILTTTSPEYVIHDRRVRLFRVQGGELELEPGTSQPLTEDDEEAG